ncbi:hypothetical protein AQUCO_01700735v1 [Aquilegia coerulea]|uniref:FYVE-type domain-containing protein n=1 Tax=Aquilegia coerulea TaxID=218851 RepID=A0A2G5DQ64_AQUCA|nr:hypothetical protein AQUCO_01700735v1 [Aquilegia coerulea]
MQVRTSVGDGFRISVSSGTSYSSQGSGPDDIESLGDVYIACGVRHAALVTRQGEVFTWGEESGGRLGHGTDRVFSRPQLVEHMSVSQVEYVSCGEYHTCATSVAGDLFVWGDGTHHAGLLGQTTEVSHWIPKRVSGPLEGLQVLSVACGSWHSALTTSNGKLFTFGDGTFGALGHGNRDSVAYPREVEILSGLKTIKVACGVWHTASIVEVMEQPGSSISLKKLFTWGDGDKYRLGHGDKETRLVPTCIASLSDYNFQQVSCGHNITVALTTSGHVFTMGSTMHGQLGNPTSDGKVPCLVQDRLTGTFIEEISCGALHVAVLTSRSEVFTWGRGANGRLGHGDTEDRKTPTLVEALRDRLVKSICCGSNFTASICIHKWVSGADQSFCSGCRQAFGFTRKRHNCYNCGLVHCHSCSSKKALRAALAPIPGKPHRVCDPCYAKLKAAEDMTISTITRKSVTPRFSIDNREKSDGKELQSSKILLSPIVEPVKYLEVKSDKPGKDDSFSIIRASLVPSLLQLKDIAFPSRFSALEDASKPVTPTTPQPIHNPRPASPYSRRPSPPRSAAHGFSKGAVDSLKKTNELLNQEVLKLQNQVKSLRMKCEVHDTELQKSQKRAQEAASVAEVKSSKLTEAKEILQFITTQLKDMSGKLPPEVYDSEDFKTMHTKLESFFGTEESDVSEVYSSLPKVCSKPEKLDMLDTSDTTVVADLPQSSRSQESGSHQSIEHGSGTPRDSTVRSEAQREVIEQFEPGVYITLVQLPNGTKMFKRVKFSKRKFNGQQAEEWWRNNSSRVLQKYNNQGTDSSAVSSSVSTSQSSSTAEETVSST